MIRPFRQYDGTIGHGEGTVAFAASSWHGYHDKRHGPSNCIHCRAAAGLRLSRLNQYRVDRFNEDYPSGFRPVTDWEPKRVDEG